MIGAIVGASMALGSDPHNNSFGSRKTIKRDPQDRSFNSGETALNRQLKSQKTTHNPNTKAM